MINKDNLKYGDIIWQVDINGSDVSLRKIEVGHLHQITGKYWISCEQGRSFEGVMLKVGSHLLFHTKQQALDYITDLWYSLREEIARVKETITNETE
jgi:hypothetical protein